MNRKLVLIMALTLLTGMSNVAFNVQNAKASGTVYIRADGSVDPPAAPISTVDNATYTLTGNITSDADGIVVERNNIIIDGAGYTVEGPMACCPIITGISLQSNVNVTIKNTSIKNFYYGIKISSSSNNTISRNNITANNEDGIGLWSSNYNSISGNNITSNGHGIYFYSPSNYNTISGNNITNNVYGISLDSSSNNSVSGNNVTANNVNGIWLRLSSGNSISGNNITANTYEGIYLESSSNYNTISGNNIANNNYGINLYDSSNNTVSGNNIANNNCGVYLRLYLAESSDNTIYHNDFKNNTKQIYDLSWDLPQSSFPSINVWDDGYPSGGNYWSDYYGVDANHDGIGDTPYVIDANNTDRYPLMAPYAIPEFPSILILPLFMFFPMLAVVFIQRRISRRQKNGR